MPNSSSPAPSLSTLIQYTVIGLVVYILAGAPQLPIPPFLSSSFPSLGLGSSQSQSSREQSAAAKDGKAGRFQGDKIENLIHPKRNLDCEEFDHGYKTHVFSREPLVVYIEGFLSESERRRVVELSDPNWRPSSIWTSGREHIDPTIRLSSKAPLPESDPTIACIEQRARSIQGWRPNVWIEKLWAQKYGAGGHYMYHYDFSAPTPTSGRVSTFMVYVEANCTGGGTNFPRIERPRGGEWCRFVECPGEGEEEGEEELTDGAGGKVEGVVFKPIAGNAVFWENIRGDGTAWPETWHAGLPVKEGTKVGLNVWSWWQEGYAPPEE